MREQKEVSILDPELSDEFEVKAWMHQGSVLSRFLYAVVVDVVIKLARECVCQASCCMPIT